MSATAFQRRRRELEKASATVKPILSYEEESNSVFDVKSIKEGDTSITYNVDEKFNRETIYSLSDKEKTTLRAFRRTRR